jgi:hypothetical protein
MSGRDMDPYLALGVTKGCNREEVKEAFRVRVQHAHPDHGGEDVTFIRLRTAYEQILVELDEDEGAGAGNRERAPHGQGQPVPQGPGDAAGTYEAWFRHVAVQADRSRPAWRSTRNRTIGLMIVLGLIVVNLMVFLIIWRSEPVPADVGPVAVADRHEEPEEAGNPIRFAASPTAEKLWQPPPAYPPDFFIIPYDATLYLAPVKGYGGATTELGIVTSLGDFLPIFTGLPGRPNPAKEVEIGPVSRWSKLRIYLKRNGEWVFSDAASSPLSRECFWDRDYSLGGRGSIIEKTSASTWLLHLDDIDSTDDDDGDILIQIRLRPKED